MKLGQVMGSHENPNPRSCKRCDTVEIGLRLIARKRCGDFVQNQELHVGARAIERNDDGDQSALRRAQARRQRIGVDREIETLQHGANLAIESRPLDSPALGRITAKLRDTFRDGERVEERRLLVHHGDAQRGAARGEAIDPTSRPPITMASLFGRYTPVSSLTVVDLPLPLAPSGA